MQKKSWLDYINNANTNRYANFVIEAENKPYLGLTANINDKNFLVIGYNGKSHILESEDGNIIQFRGQLSYTPRTPHNAILAASRQSECIPRGNLFYLKESNTWLSRIDDFIIPLDRYIQALDSVGWSKAAFARLSHEVEEEDKDKKEEPLVCPDCGSHTLELINRDNSVFLCHSCKNQFEHPVYFNPKSHVLSYEVDDEGKGNYAPGPDHPRKVICDCGYNWKSYHEFAVTGGQCPRCNKKHLQENVQAMEGGEGWKNPKQPHHKSKEEKGWKNRYDYREAADQHFSCHNCSYYSNEHCSMFDASVDEDYTCDEWQGEKTSKTATDYNTTTDSMSGHDTGAPIRENPLDYDENVHNQNEVASPSPMAPMDNFPKQDEQLGLHTPKGSVHRMVNNNGDQILVMSDGKGGAMGWAPYNGEMTTESVKWDTSNLYKIEDAINQGNYQAISKTARKHYTLAEQKELIDESKDKLARNAYKLDLSNTHYELIDIDSKFTWLW